MLFTANAAESILCDLKAIFLIRYHPFSLLSVALVTSASMARRIGSGNAGQASMTRLRGLQIRLADFLFPLSDPQVCPSG